LTPKVFIRAAALKSTRTSNWVWNIGWASGHKSNHGKDHTLHHMQRIQPRCLLFSSRTKTYKIKILESIQRLLNFLLPLYSALFLRQPTHQTLHGKYSTVQHHRPFVCLCSQKINTTTECATYSLQNLLPAACRIYLI